MERFIKRSRRGREAMKYGETELSERRELRRDSELWKRERRWWGGWIEIEQDQERDGGMRRRAWWREWAAAECKEQGRRGGEWGDAAEIRMLILVGLKNWALKIWVNSPDLCFVPVFSGMLRAALRCWEPSKVSPPSIVSKDQLQTKRLSHN